MPSDMAFRKHFGSWGKALIASGFKPTKFIPVGARKGKRNKIRKRILSHGYILVYEPAHPMAMKNGYVREHRMIAYDTGKLVNKKDEIHHENNIKTDNSGINLIPLSKPEHTKITHIGRKISDKHPKCKFCEVRTKSKYGLCAKHYKREWAKEHL